MSLLSWVLRLEAHERAQGSAIHPNPSGHSITSEAYVRRSSIIPAPMSINPDRVSVKVSWNHGHCQFCCRRRSKASGAPARGMLWHGASASMLPRESHASASRQVHFRAAFCRSSDKALIPVLYDLPLYLCRTPSRGRASGLRLALISSLRFSHPHHLSWL